METCVDFSLIGFYFSSQIFFIVYMIIIKFFSNRVTDFIPNFIVFF